MARRSSNRPSGHANRAHRNAKWALEHKQNGLCFWCKTPIFKNPLDWRDRLSADHYPIKYIDGGSCSRTNIVAAHRRCNT